MSRLFAAALAALLAGCSKDDTAPAPAADASPFDASTVDAGCVQQDPVICRCGIGVDGPLELCAGAVCCHRAQGDCYCRKNTSTTPAACDQGDEPAAFCKRDTVRNP